MKAELLGEEDRHRVEFEFRTELERHEQGAGLEVIEHPDAHTAAHVPEIGRAARRVRARLVLVRVARTAVDDARGKALAEGRGRERAVHDRDHVARERHVAFAHDALEAARSAGDRMIGGTGLCRVEQLGLGHCQHGLCHAAHARPR